MASCKGPIFQVERMILVEGSLHVIKSVHAIGQLYTYSDMYEFWNVIFVENSEESAVMRYTAEYVGLS